MDFFKRMQLLQNQQESMCLNLRCTEISIILLWLTYLVIIMEFCNTRKGLKVPTFIDSDPVNCRLTPLDKGTRYSYSLELAVYYYSAQIARKCVVTMATPTSVNLNIVCMHLGASSYARCPELGGYPLFRYCYCSTYMEA